jgi:hypothetical protein
MQDWIHDDWGLKGTAPDNCVLASLGPPTTWTQRCREISSIARLIKGGCGCGMIDNDNSHRYQAISIQDNVRNLTYDLKSLDIGDTKKPYLYLLDLGVIKHLYRMNDPVSQMRMR